MPLILWFKYCILTTTRLRSEVVTNFDLIILSTTRGVVKIIKANDTETTITPTMVEVLLTDSLVRDIPLYFMCISLHKIAALVSNMVKIGTSE